MSSIRPLATITLLALVGVFLYLKINETEPPLPADIANWTMPNQLDIGGGPAIGAAPQIGAPATTSSAPAPPATTTAPSFTPAPTTTPAHAPSTAPTFTSSPPAASETSAAPALKVPELPSLPAIPPASSTTTAETTPPGATTPAVPATTAPSSTPAVAPSTTTAAAPAPQQSSLFAATRTAVQGALDRGELSQALLLLSDWYGDPSLSPSETQEVNNLLSQLAGSVIYSTEHRLEPPYMVQAGEQLPDIAQKYNVPWQLLAKINGLAEGAQLQPGQQLKVIRGPFTALVDLSERRLTLMLDRRYAGQFPVEIDPATSVEEGQWSVNQKLLTPGIASPVAGAGSTSEQKTIMMTSTTGGASQIVILRGAGPTTPATTDPAGRVIRLKSQDVNDVYDILSLGSSVTIRR